MTTWEDVARAVKTAVVDGVTYADVALVSSVADYLSGNVAQAIVRDYLILIGPPEEGSYEAEPMLSGLFRKGYNIDIAIVAKTDPSTMGRMLGIGKRGIYQVQSDVLTALEHKNLSGLVDNKAGSNFEVPWAQRPTDNKAITVYTTIYTAVKTER